MPARISFELPDDNNESLIELIQGILDNPNLSPSQKKRAIEALLGKNPRS